MSAINLTNLLFLAASAQGVFLGVLILHKYRRLLANRFLAVLLFLHAGLLLHMSLQNMAVLDTRPRLVMMTIGVAFLIGPLHFLYTRFLTRPGVSPTWRVMWHFVPFLVYELLVVAFYQPDTGLATAGVTPDQKAAWFHNFGFYHLAVMLQYGAYLAQTQRVLKRYGQRLPLVFSTLDRVKLTWLRNITWLAVFVIGVYSVEFFLLLMDIGTGEYFVYSSLLLAINVYAMGYLGLFNSEVLASSAVRETLQVTPEIIDAEPAPTGEGDQPAKYGKSGLSADDLELYQQKLLQLMAAQAPYTESNLTLDLLAGMVGLSPHNLSEVINRGLGLNFFDFVNGYRVQEVQKSLVDREKAHLTVLALALEAGFASKSSFNAIFKKHTGLTPTAWRKEHQNN